MGIHYLTCNIDNTPAQRTDLHQGSFNMHEGRVGQRHLHVCTKVTGQKTAETKPPSETCDLQP